MGTLISVINNGDGIDIFVSILNLVNTDSNIGRQIDTSPLRARVGSEAGQKRMCTCGSSLTKNDSWCLFRSKSTPTVEPTWMPPSHRCSWLRQCINQDLCLSMYMLQPNSSLPKKQSKKYERNKKNKKIKR